jgi:PAS domain S-box-containing protein
VHRDDLYRLLVTSVRDYAILVLDPQGRILTWNEGAQQIKGYTADEIVGKEFCVFYPPEEVRRGVPAEALRIAAQEGRWEAEGWRVRKDGSRFWANVVITALVDATGTLVGSAKVTRDLSERKQAEEAIREAKDEAERANAAKSEFLSRMSHELRTPLNAILGFAQLLDLDDVSPLQHDNIAQILKAGRHLLDLINEVLDLTRIETGHLTLSIEPVAVAEVLHEALVLIRPLAGTHNVHLGEVPAVSATTQVLADQQRLKQVLLNLLANAVKYNRPGGTVTLACRPMTDDRLRLEVHDTGLGIPPEKLDRLFVPFERLGAEQTPVEGTGLGLALCKRLVELMGGAIGVTSTVGQGSTFWIDLACPTPVELHDVGDAPALEGATTGPAVPGAAGTLLYIEDNLSNLQLVEQLLRYRPGVKLVAAMQGRLGLELAREHQPGLIVLDLHLPDLGGQEVLGCLRAEARTAGIPVVVLSADATPGQVARLRAAGAAAYLTKPLDVQQFLGVVDDLMSHHSLAHLHLPSTSFTDGSEEPNVEATTQRQRVPRRANG